MYKMLAMAVLATGLSFSVRAERVLTGAEAWKEIKGAETIRYKDFSSIPAYIKFKPGHQIYFDQWQQWISERYFKSNNDISFELIGSETDRLGMTHYRYRQAAQGYPLEFGTWIVHTRDGKVQSMNGELFDSVPKFSPGLSEAAALEFALDAVGASVYKWQIPAEEQLLQSENNDPEATYYPKGNLSVINEDVSLRKVDLRLAWKFNIYAHEPMSRAEIYVDAQTGALIFENDLIHHTDSIGTAVTGYTGTQQIVADYTGTEFRLQETGRGNGIQTYNMNGGTNYGNATDFTDSDNFWSTTSLDQYGTDAHWGAEMTYDFFWENFNRNSINDNGFTLRSYVHYDIFYGNAFWDGQRMTYGDGDNGNSPFTAIDITGHEISHGLTEFTADLVYQDEPGALNESFSDIFGTAVEFFALGSIADWLMGEDLGFVIRSMSNPGLYDNPDTYGGDYWYVGNGDNGGVHTNSGVQNYWFYLLCQGGVGTNDLGDNYNVQAIGMDDAQAIAFRNLTVYLTTSSQYEDARFYAIESALDLFGPCSQEVISTGMAWYAVGVGTPYQSTVVADFISSSTGSCEVPFEVNFVNLSSNATSYTWDFGDGGSSTQANPTHTYTQAGTYTVVLQVSSSCGNDTRTEADYIALGPEVPCEVNLPEFGTGPVQSSCEGVLFDNGGPIYNYLNNTDVFITIAPCVAQTVTLYFDEFDIEPGGGANCIYDYLSVYDGPSTTSPLIGKYCNSNLPPSSVTSTGSEVTVRMRADGGLNMDGFRISWECTESNELPIAEFEAPYTETCSGVVSFEDISENCPDQWLWDFGDGNTSTDQHPTHQYTANGTYTVKLTATNTVGNNTMTKPAYILVNGPDAPLGSDVEICPGDVATLIATGAGENRWYDDIFGTSAIHIGDTLVTPPLGASTSYYVETVVPNVPQNVGPVNNTFGSGSYYNNGPQHLFFDVFASLELVSVKVFAAGGGDRTIQLRDNNGSVLEELTVTMTGGPEVINLNFMIEPGTDYELGVSDDTEINMYRNNGGVDFPYEIGNVLSITRSSANTDPYAYYYFFYDWVVRDLCISERSTLVASTGMCLGVEDVAGPRVRVYPNPSNGRFTVEWKDAGVKTVQVLNAQGSLVNMFRPLPSDRHVNMTLAAGVYFLKVDTQQGVTTERIVVQ